MMRSEMKIQNPRLSLAPLRRLSLRFGQAPLLALLFSVLPTTGAIAEITAAEFQSILESHTAGRNIPRTRKAAFCEQLRKDVAFQRLNQSLRSPACTHFIDSLNDVGGAADLARLIQPALAAEQNIGLISNAFSTLGQMRPIVGRMGWVAPMVVGVGGALGTLQILSPGPDATQGEVLVRGAGGAAAGFGTGGATVAASFGVRHIRARIRQRTAQMTSNLISLLEECFPSEISFVDATTPQAARERWTAHAGSTSSTLPRPANGNAGSLAGQAQAHASARSEWCARVFQTLLGLTSNPDSNAVRDPAQTQIQGSGQVVARSRAPELMTGTGVVQPTPEFRLGQAIGASVPAGSIGVLAVPGAAATPAAAGAVLRRAVVVP